MHIEKRLLVSVGKRIREIRETKRLSRNMLADIISEDTNTTMSPTTLLSIESGRGANLRTIIRVADALSVPISSLFEMADAKTMFGMRAYEQALHLFGYSAARHRQELRLNLEGAAFAVSTIEELHSHWYTGPIKVFHEVTTLGHEYGNIFMCEPPFEVLSKPAEKPVLKRRWIHADTRMQDDAKRFHYEISLPLGLGEEKMSYRYTSSTSRSHQVFAEVALIPPEAFKPYGDPPDIPPQDLPGLVVGAEKEYKRMSEAERRELPPCIAWLCCTEFPVEELVLTVKFPQDYTPPFFAARCWPGRISWVEATENLTKKLLSPENHQLLMDGPPPQLRLEVQRPVMGVSYAIFWWPPPFEEYWPLYQDYLKSKS